jgi:predicted alpha/beta superfamily hydrolase
MKTPTRTIIVISLFSLVLPCLTAQEPTITLSIDSEVLEEMKEVYISLPANYNDSTQYPVIMIMEAEILFETISPLPRLMSSVREIPECVLVGVPLNNEHLDFAPVISTHPESGHADSMLEFFEKELFPQLESGYNCTTERIIWAHSAMAGIFCTYLLVGPDSQFSGIISSSPNLSFMEPDYLSKEDVFAKLGEKHRMFYYMSFGGNEAKTYMENMAPRVEKLAKMLEAKAPENLTWEYHLNENNTHFSNAIETYIEGVMAYFSYAKKP